MTDGSRFSSVRLRPVASGDRGRVRAWLADAAIRAWWGAPAAIEAEIVIAIESVSAICRMIEADGVAIGYGHAFDSGLIDTRGAGSEPGIWHCTFFIGSEPHRGIGVGATALDLLATEVLATTLAIGCETRVPVQREAAVREIEAKGFRWQRIETDPGLGPVWIMRRDRHGVAGR